MSVFKQVITLTACLIILFMGLTAYLIIDYRNARKAFNAIADAKENRYRQMKASQEASVQEALERKYSTDMTSFEATINQIEEERKRAERLEAQITADSQRR
jgi:archaellum component FlaF (FlaF/FlaG flagellin family)